MSNFKNFYNEFLQLVNRHERDSIPLKIEKDLENNIIKIFGENITSLEKAKNGLKDVLELSLATAEHHPFWNLLYNSSEISNIILEKWKSNLSREDVSDIEWAIKELNHTLEKIKEQSS